MLNPLAAVPAIFRPTMTAAMPTDRPAHLARLQPHAEMLRRYLFVLGAGVDRLDDLVQEVFLVALKKPFDDSGPSWAAAWLRGVARNVLLRDRRTAASRREVELVHEVWEQQCADGSGDARIALLQRCIEGLPERSRALLQQTYAEGIGRDELAGRFGMRRDGIKTALRRLRAALRNCVERRREGER
jgi:RNA polymerase sigma-70 factor, ECF subfamily